MNFKTKSFNIIFFCRYEIASDENRGDLVYDLAKRYLGLCTTEGQATEDSGGGGGDGDDGKCDDDSGIGADTKTKLSNHDDHHEQGQGQGKDKDKTVKNNGSSAGANQNATGKVSNSATAIRNPDDDDFVLDVLNDDIVAQVRSKLLGKFLGAFWGVFGWMITRFSFFVQVAARSCLRHPCRPSEHSSRGSRSGNSKRQCTFTGECHTIRADCRLAPIPAFDLPQLANPHCDTHTHTRMVLRCGCRSKHLVNTIVPGNSNSLPSPPSGKPHHPNGMHRTVQNGKCSLLYSPPPSSTGGG